MSTPETTTITDKLHSMIDEFSTAMLITRPGDGAPKARPMFIAAHDETGLWFVTSRDNELVEEISRDAGCAVSMQGHGRYVALRGLAELHDDAARVRELWSETMRPWFPRGPSAPEILLISCSPLEGEYWDISGVRMVKLLFRAAKAYTSGKPLEHDDLQHHATVTLP